MRAFRQPKLHKRFGRTPRCDSVPENHPEEARAWDLNHKTRGTGHASTFLPYGTRDILRKFHRHIRRLRRRGDFGIPVRRSREGRIPHPPYRARLWRLRPYINNRPALRYRIPDTGDRFVCGPA